MRQRISGDGRRRPGLVAALVLLSGLCGGVAAAQDAPSVSEPVKPEAFEDWELFCPEPTPTDKPRICEIRTIIKSQEGGRLGALAVAANPDPGAKAVPMIATALLPLGVDLTMAPALKIDEGQALTLQFRRCLRRGCEAVAVLDDAQLAALRAGALAKVAVGIGGGKTGVFEFSLSGFTAAHEAMNEAIDQS